MQMHRANKARNNAGPTSATYGLGQPTNQPAMHPRFHGNPEQGWSPVTYVAKHNGVGVFHGQRGGNAEYAVRVNADAHWSDNGPSWKRRVYEGNKDPCWIDLN